MKLFLQPAPQSIPATPGHAFLDVVVPFTTPELTVAALRVADSLGDGLHTEIRLLRIQVVPYPLDLRRPPVPAGFLKQQLESLCRLAGQHNAQVQYDIRTARDLASALRDALKDGSLVVLATRRRPWRTRSERLATILREDGFNVLLVRNSAERKEHARCGL
jgi:hypothetical protein